MQAITRRLQLAIVATSALSACAVGPDYQRPTILTPDRFMGQPAIDGRAATNESDLTIWWQGFQDPVLTHFVELALAQSLDLAQARARLLQTRAAYRGSRAAMLPQGNVQADAAWARESLQTPLGQLLNAVPSYRRDSGYYEGDVGASWELDVFGGLRRGKEAATAEFNAAQAGMVATRLAVAAQTADIYITVRGLQTRLAIARQQVDTRERLLTLIRQQLSNGVAAQLQVSQGEGSLAQAAATVPVLEAALESALNAMDVMMGAQPGTFRGDLTAPASIPEAPQLANTGTPADLIQRRPDLIVAERRLAAANARIGVAISDYYPKFSLGALIGTATTQSRGVFTNGATQAQGVLGIRWRLFDFGRVDAEIAAAKGKDAEALAAYRLAVLRASEDVENSFSALVKYESQAQVLSQGEMSLAHARDLSATSYQRGVVSLVEVLIADSTLLQVSDARAQAQADAASSAVASFLALGGGWDVNESKSGEAGTVARVR